MHLLWNQDLLRVSLPAAWMCKEVYITRCEITPSMIRTKSGKTQGAHALLYLFGCQQKMASSICVGLEGHLTKRLFVTHISPNVNLGSKKAPASHTSKQLIASGRVEYTKKSLHQDLAPWHLWLGSVRSTVLFSAQISAALCIQCFACVLGSLSFLYPSHLLNSRTDTKEHTHLRTK